MEYKDLEKVNKEIGTIDVKGKQYAEVPQRIKAFRKLFPNGSIETEIVSLDDHRVVMKCVVKNEEGRVLSTAHAYENEGSSFINKTSFIENCCTSCTGRALGYLGIGIDTSVASFEEVANAQLQQTAEATINKAKLDTIKALKIDPEIAKGILGSYGYTKSTEIKNKDFADIFETLKNCSEEATND